MVVSTGSTGGGGLGIYHVFACRVDLHGLPFHARQELGSSVLRPRESPARQTLRRARYGFKFNRL